MNSKSKTRIAVLVSVIILAAVFASFGYSVLFTRTPSITLPDTQPGGGGHTSGSGEAPLVQVDVTRHTVQAVIAQLQRPDSYYRQLTVETFWSSGSSATQVQTWVDGGYTYVRAVLPSGQIRCSLAAGEDVYYWYEGSSEWLTAPQGALSADLTQRIPTYEDVLELPLRDISDAGSGLQGEEYCVYAETTADEFGYLERYWVSVDSGLLVRAETVQDGQVVYSMSSAGPLQTPCPGDVAFQLPDGTVPQLS